jgi:hypothetical protein
MVLFGGALRPFIGYDQIPLASLPRLSSARCLINLPGISPDQRCN